MDTNIIAVDWNVSLEKDIYYILYKNILMKYIKCQQGYADNLLFFCNPQNKNNFYKIATEFLRAFTYANNLKLLVYSGGTVHNNINRFSEIIRVKNGGGGRKNIPIDTQIKHGFLYIAHIDNDEKSQLVRLFTEATSNNNIYFKILFLWHSLVYPERNEEKAIEYINEKFDFIDKNGWYRDNLVKFAVFKNIKWSNLGYYIKQNVRHAIAHIVRYKNTDVNIVLDDLTQIGHLYIIAKILQDVAKERLDKIYNLSENASREICSLINPDIFDFEQYHQSLLPF